MDRDDMPVMSRPQTLRGQIEQFLCEAIMNGRFAPGERLIERELCEMLQVSRPPLREALNRLEADRLIKIVPHKGPVVASLDRNEARELYALRALLEGHAVYEFARLASDENIAQLAVAVKGLHQAAEKPERLSLLAAKSAIYEILLNGCGNRLISEVLHGLLKRINLLRATSFSQPDRLRASLQEIDGLLEAIRQRNPDAARESAIAHIKNAEIAALNAMSDEA